MSIYPYRHRATGDSAGWTIVYYADGRRVTYKNDSPDTYTVEHWESVTASSKYSPDRVMPMREKDFECFEAIPTLDEQQARAGRRWEDYVDEHGYA